MEIGVARVDTADPVFTHEDRCVRIVHQIPSNEWELGEDFRRDGRMTARGDQNAKRGRRQKRFDELPGALYRPRFAKDPRMRAHAQKLVDNWPREIPCRALSTPVIDQLAATLVRWRVLVGSVDEDVGIDHEHVRYRPSIA